jgi:hypothetical protein
MRNDTNGAVVFQHSITRYPVIGEPLLDAATRPVHAASSLRASLLRRKPTPVDALARSPRLCRARARRREPQRLGERQSCLRARPSGVL